MTELPITRQRVIAAVDSTLAAFNGEIYLAHERQAIGECVADRLGLYEEIDPDEAAQ